MLLRSRRYGAIFAECDRFSEGGSAACSFETMDCFISYSVHDRKVARLLKEKLARRGISVFLAEDPESNPLGGNWRGNTQSAAKRCDVMVLLDSSHSRQSAWVQQEAGMAFSSGSLLIPVSMDADREQLPGWLSDLQAIRMREETDVEESLSFIVEQVCDHLGQSWISLPPELREPMTVGSHVLRTVLLDQFSGSDNRAGGWSRQYNRYLSIYYGENKSPPGVSQGVSLTLTGMIVERLAGLLLSIPGGLVASSVDTALKRASGFVLRSQHPQEGGFGRLSSDLTARGEHALALDLRHTVWAIRALLSIDTNRYGPQIGKGLRWLSTRIQVRGGADKECWTTAALLALMNDPRLLDMEEWQRASMPLKKFVEADLLGSFDERLASWVIGEKQPGLVWVDNALYVMYCLAGIGPLSDEFRRQRDLAIQRLLASSWMSAAAPAARGIPLFNSDSPEVGPTAQLLEILLGNNHDVDTNAYANFVASEISNRHILPQTFSWHLVSILAIPELRQRELERGLG